MTFIARKTKYRAWPVTVITQVLNEATGEVTEVSSKFIGYFKPFTESQFGDIVDALDQEFPPPADLDGKRDMDVPRMLERNAKLFGQLLDGWNGVRDEDGEALTFSKETLADLVIGPDGLVISAALNKAIYELRWGIAPAKNSEPSPGPGLAPGAEVGGADQTNLTTTAGDSASS